MVSEPLDLFGEAVGMERLDGADDVGVRRAPPLGQQTAVGDLMGESVAEGVLDVREEAGLVEARRGRRCR